MDEQDTFNVENLESETSLQSLGLLLGFISTACFTLLFLPQVWINYQRKSIQGFSTTSILIKLVGASFLFSNAFLLFEEMPVVLYGAFNVIQQVVFLIQFESYTGDKHYLNWIGFPAFPLVLGYFFPSSLAFTNFVKPATQILSHLPQLWLCWAHRSTAGVSMFSQHLNLLGGIAGLYMCFLIPPKSVLVTAVYVNSIVQAASLFLLAMYFEGPKRLLSDIPFVSKRDPVTAA